MRPKHRKEYQFVSLLCPSVKLKSGRREFIADWEVMEPLGLQGRHLVVHRQDSRPFLDLQLMEINRSKRMVLLKTRLEPNRSGEFYHKYRLVSIHRQNDYVIVRGLLGFPELTLRKVKVFGEV